jgi:predicted dehydrogenase
MATVAVTRLRLPQGEDPVDIIVSLTDVLVLFYRAIDGKASLRSVAIDGAVSNSRALDGFEAHISSIVRIYDVDAQGIVHVLAYSMSGKLQLIAIDTKSATHVVVSSLANSLSGCFIVRRMVHMSVALLYTARTAQLGIVNVTANGTGLQMDFTLLDAGASLRDSYTMMDVVVTDSGAPAVVAYSLEPCRLDVFSVALDALSLTLVSSTHSSPWTHMFVVDTFRSVVFYDGASSLATSTPPSSPAVNRSVSTQVGSFEVLSVSADGTLSLDAVNRWTDDGPVFNRCCLHATIGNRLLAFTRRKIQVAAVGCGHRMREIIHLLRVRHDVDIQLVAVCDAPNAEADEFRGIPKFANIETMLRFVPSIEWVLIASMNSEHAQQTVAALNAGKHVFCEKPLAHTWEACQDIMRTYNEHRKQRNALFATGFVLRHAPFYVQIKNMIDQGMLGRIVSLEANELLSPAHGGYIMRNWRRHREKSGPHMLEKCCHDMDVLHWLLGSLPVRVASFGGTNVFVPENRPSADEMDDDTFRQTYCAWPHAWEDVDPFTSTKDVEDNQVCILEYASGVRATFHANTCCGVPQRRIVLCGTRGSIEADLVSGELVFRSAEAYGAGEDVQRWSFGARGLHGGGDSKIVDDLHHAMISGERPFASGEEGMLSAVVCLAIDKAMHDGQVVDVKQLWRQVQSTMPIVPKEVC